MCDGMLPLKFDQLSFATKFTTKSPSQTVTRIATTRIELEDVLSAIDLFFKLISTAAKL